jgi:hypothetical protein
MSAEPCAKRVRWPAKFAQFAGALEKILALRGIPD